MVKLFLFLLFVFSSTEAMATGLSYTHLDSGNGTVAAPSFSTNSISVTANEMVIIIFSAKDAAGGGFTVSSVVYNGTSTSLTDIVDQSWTQGVAAVPSHRVALTSAYYFISSGSSSGTITVTYTPSNVDMAVYAWSTFAFTGENTTTPIVQNIAGGACNTTSTCTSLTASLGSSITSNDATVAAFANGNPNENIAGTTGYTAIDNIATNQYQLTEYEITGTQNPSATWTAADAGALAFEVGVGPSGSISKVAGVANASISKISGVAQASIGKIAGVTGP